MKKQQKKLSIIAVMFAALLAFTFVPSAKADAASKTEHTYTGADYIITPGKSVQLSTGNSCSYVSDNPRVATVDANGKVVGKSGGYAVITVTSSYGTKSNVEIGVKTKSYYPNITDRYKVGKDIPAGQYVLLKDPQVSGNFAYWALYKNKNSSYLRNDGFSYTSIVTLKKGQYLDFNGCYAVPIKRVNKNVFSLKNLNKYGLKEGATVKVGYGFAAGTYKFTLAKGHTSGSIHIASKDRGLNPKYNYISTSYLSTSRKTVTIKVKKGQYVEIEGATVKRK